MYKIVNTTNSPFDIPSPNGNVRLPAFGTVETDLTSEYLEVLRASGAVTVEESQAKKPVAKPEPVEEDDIETLRAQYADLAEKPADGRWSAARLRTEIDNLLVQ